MFAMMFAIKQHIRPYWAELFPNHDALATTTSRFCQRREQRSALIALQMTLN